MLASGIGVDSCSLKSAFMVALQADTGLGLGWLFVAGLGWLRVSNHFK